MNKCRSRVAALLLVEPQLPAFCRSEFRYAGVIQWGRDRRPGSQKTHFPIKPIGSEFSTSAQTQLLSSFKRENARLRQLIDELIRKGEGAAE